MDMFPYVRADAYFDFVYDKDDKNQEIMKKFFVAQIPVWLHKDNVEYLDPKSSLFQGDDQLVHVSIVRSRRGDANDQLQISMTNMDSSEFVAFRKLLHAQSYIVFLKRKEKLEYDLYGIKSQESGSMVGHELDELNNKFFKDATRTPVRIEEIAQGNTAPLADYGSFVWDDIPILFHDDISRRFITSLLAKPFVILTGNSGTGKTRIATQFAKYLEVDEDGAKNWELVPVGADWTDNTKILGFYNPLANDGKGEYVKTSIVSLIERANAHSDIPHFLILDEMNLSHVERYFSDFLSHMEVPDQPFKLDGYPGGFLPFPANLFVVGTVNIDETTYMFSPKVLDRANVVEFKPDEEDILGLFDGGKGSQEIVPAGESVARAFLSLAQKIRDPGYQSTLEMGEVKDFFKSVYDKVADSGFEFAYRAVREIRQYVCAAYELEEDKGTFDLERAEDEQLVQKILPKIHGNKKELDVLLHDLRDLCGPDENPKKMLSHAKIGQMIKRLEQVQYASFI
ncbi:MAG: AAA family ATPase [Sphaerochaetaceae bacterium]|nr:AAA family ATPase [Spirochaetales bacterium]MDY5500776.1 AAA family ATPase [Sphaerochaetaceae bacterium]